MNAPDIPRLAKLIGEREKSLARANRAILADIEEALAEGGEVAELLDAAACYIDFERDGQNDAAAAALEEYMDLRVRLGTTPQARARRRKRERAAS